MESENENTKSETCLSLPGIVVKTEHDVITESNIYQIQNNTEPKARSLAKDSYFSSYLNLFPISSATKIKKWGNSTRFKNESQEKRAARLARMSARAAERIAAESPEQRQERLAKISEYSAKRLANESLAERSLRLKKMSVYTASRIAQESDKQRTERLSRMAEYSAKRIANETKEQRQARLLKMSAYSARRRALKKAAECSQINVIGHL
ncbi:PREDICTED: uncharacterized protein LOC106103981 [Papilio polytes]|uniref:uncharacterized protein LOC106103981 n=1 Tax=Papilio polytes TaxID=76194 RepID=UPI000675C6F7|nr:PREDICTED: uncharacterized protein LOC106103981 [Papilio polytes]